MRLPALVLVAALALPSVPSAQAVTAFTNVSVVPMDRERVLENQTVVVQGSRVIAMGPAGRTPVPAGAVRIEARGRYLMPGLGEMHAHIPGGQASPEMVDRVLFLFLANGVTTVRGMLGDPRHLELRDRAARGEILSPAIHTSGPSINGNSAPSVEVVQRMVAEQKAAGYDFIKIHPGLRREVFDSMAAAAQRAGLTFSGHVPLEVGLERALEAPYATIDHLDGYAEYLLDAGAPVSAAQSQFFGLNFGAYLDDSRIPQVAAATGRAGVWNVPTEILMENLAGDASVEQLLAREEIRYWYPAQVDQWVAARRQFEQTPEADRAAWINTRRTIIRRLHEAGAGLLLGSDAPQMWNVPGFSAHRELEALVAAGLTPFEALETGTRNVAVFFRSTDSTGTVAVGKTADLILLDANPLTDIRNSRRIHGVMVRGRWLSRAELDAGLARLAEKRG
ncbi:MAG: amidohydrolase family protein [Gemmatimonadales bacterium]